jgi:signal transduction histidine kinase
VLQVPRILRTSSFKLTLLYGSLTTLGYVLLFGIVFWATTHFMERQIDASISGELAEIQAAAPTGDSAALRDVVAGLIARSPDFFYLLQNADGSVLAGNLPAMEPRAGVRQWPGSARHRGTPFSGIRGRGIRTDWGGYLFVGLSTVQLHELEELFEHAAVWGLALAMVSSLAGGAAMSWSFLRRIAAVSQTSREIIDGDLARRIPERGTNDEFDHLAASLNAMLDRIQTLMEGLRQVSNDIAHDLRTPLTRLRQRLELARLHGGATSPNDEVIASTLRDVDAILETFGALLRIAQIESGARKAGFAPLDLGEMLLNVVEIYQSAIEEKRQTLRVRLEPEIFVNGDRELLTQLFANLLDNATRHSPPGTHIEIAAVADREAGADRERVAVSVADDGPGVPREFREKVLQRFFRLEASRSSPGNGLGLSLVQAVARLHETDLILDDHAPGLRARLSLRMVKAQTRA